MDTSLSYESSVWQEIVKYDTTSQYDKEFVIARICKAWACKFVAIHKAEFVFKFIDCHARLTPCSQWRLEVFSCFVGNDRQKHALNLQSVQWRQILSFWVSETNEKIHTLIFWILRQRLSMTKNNLIRQDTSQYDKKLSVMINNVLKKLFKFKPHCEFFEFFKKIAAKSIKIAWIYGVCVKISSLSLAFWVKVFSVFAYSFCQPNLGAKVFPPPPRQIYNERPYRQRRNLALARHYTNAHCPCLCWWDNQALMKGL